VSRPPSSPAEHYAAVVEAVRGDPDVTFGSRTKGFGSSALKVGGKIFAMLIEDGLVVKLPRQRVDALIASGGGDRFDPGHGRPMKEWATIGPTAAERWLPLVREAMEFVAARR
jgi:hypothetical protein